jgi:hypothetical protein
MDIERSLAESQPDRRRIGVMAEPDQMNFGPARGKSELSHTQNGFAL